MYTGPNETRYYKLFTYRLGSPTDQHEVMCYWNDGISKSELSQVVTRKGTKAEMEALIAELNCAIPNEGVIRHYLQQGL